MYSTREGKLIKLGCLLWEKRRELGYHWIIDAMSPHHRTSDKELVDWETYERLVRLCAKRQKNPRKLADTVAWYVEAISQDICPVCKSKLYGKTCCYEQDYSC